jgi:hypothetical protein
MLLCQSYLLFLSMNILKQRLVKMLSYLGLRILNFIIEEYKT